ncbi:MAG: hypothetical protein JST40_01485 [Armatimonadetes bacterium]|nr:hypothetical protein [Armatimonadota bacterium]
MKRAAIGCAVLSLAMVVPAHADIDTSGLRLRVGGVYPFEQPTRRVTGNMIGIGLEFPLKVLSTVNQTYLSLDWLGKSGSGAKGNMFPFMVNQRYYLDKNPENGTRNYFFAGVGGVSIDVNKSKIAYGARLGLGRDFGENLFAEGTLLFSSDAAGAKANSFGVYLGYRF